MKLRARKFKLKKLTLQPDRSDEPPQKAEELPPENKKNHGVFEITPQLYMSGYDSACDSASLYKLGITHVVNLSSQHCPNSNFSEIQYSSFALSDNPEFNLIPHLDDILNLIVSQIRMGNRVLVHCKMGISRAPSIVMAFLIKSLGMTLDNAMNYVLNINSRVSPNLGYLIQLEGL
jgi:atypical dual specificity phosphatase